MNTPATFQFPSPNPVDTAGILSWVHIGDLHMRHAGEQSDLDLRAIVEEINVVFADSISFVFLPGGNADHGDLEGYTVVRQALDQLRTPWCAIVGDHDVEQKSFNNFKAFMAEHMHYAFTVGSVRFLALNAFDFPSRPRLPFSLSSCDGSKSNSVLRPTKNRKRFYCCTAIQATSSKARKS